MSASIQKSAASYSSGLECWAAFCDALGIEVQFPASEELVIRFPPLFHNRTTLQQYVKHLRWGTVSCGPRTRGTRALYVKLFGAE